MRTSRFAVLAAGLLGMIAGCGDDGKITTKGELILALQTDMELPKDVDKVRIRVASYGSTVFSNDYQVGPTELKIPATLALFANPDRPSAPVTIQVIGFRQAKPRVMRETVTTIPGERIATLRVPIEWLCDESARTDNGEVVSTCPSEETCIAGTCLASMVDSDELPDFKPTDIFGGGDGSGNGVCFDTAQCFADPINLSVDMATCRATLPSDETNVNIALKPAAAGEGICSGGVCVIPLDGGEGGQWSRAGSGGDQGATVQLPKGVCDRLQAGKIETVIASKQCATKTWRVPTCGPWSSSGGSGNTQVDGGGTGADASTGSDAGSAEDGGTTTDVTAPPETGPTSDVTDTDAGPATDAGGGSDAGMGGNDVCTLDNCGQPPICQPPPAPPDGGTCMGIMSSPPHNGVSACQWDVPGGIATTGMGFCANLLNLQLLNAPGMPGPTPIFQVGEGQCNQGPGWQFSPSQLVIELCPLSCMPVKDAGTAVQFIYGCPTFTTFPDGGTGPKDAAPPPDGPGFPDSAPPFDASTDGGVGMASMVPVIGGTFQMGCLATDIACNSDELPLHPVDVSDFAIDETEVTQGAYDLCIRAGMCVAPPCSSWQPSTKANWPVACVNWTEANNYCNWLGRRLPTEAEWEIAAHGNAGFIYPWGNATPDCTRANFTLCSFSSTQAVKSFIAGKSVFNAYDMAGNIGEWVFDWYGSYETPSGPNPTGPPTGTQRVVRGGDYQAQSSVMRASHRMAIDPNTRVDDIGFRCAKPGF
jgi:formylglycine-generating enzyme required for sulfatase activity